MGNAATPDGSSNLPADRAYFVQQRLSSKKVWVESPLNRNELDIYWVPTGFAASRYPVGYNVYRGISPKFSLDLNNVTKLNSSPITIPMYRDLTVDLRRSGVLYYTVTQVLADGTELPLDQPATLHLSSTGRRTKNISMPRIYAEYRRRKYIILNNDAEIVDILIRKQAGTRCTCFNGEYETTAKPQCTDCYGTGWDRGYELLPDVLCRILTIAEVLKLNPQGLQFSSNPKAWLVEFPIMRNGDIVVRRNGDRSEVNNLDLNTHQGILTEQNFDLVNLDSSHPVHLYQIPLSDGP